MKAPRFALRHSHPRQKKRGGSSTVRDHWVLQELGVTDRKSSYRHPCPTCGSEIISVRMPNGGWAHLEGQRKLSKIKHPCLHIGERLGRATDDLTQDLFDKE